MWSRVNWRQKLSCWKYAKKVPKTPVRVWMGVLIFFAAFVNFTIRTHVAISIVGMTYPPYSWECHTEVLDPPENSNITIPNRFKWDPLQQSHVLAAYYLGFVSFSIAAGFVLDYLDAYSIVYYTSILSVVVNTLTPLAAKNSGWGGVVAARVVAGALGGIWMPALDVLVMHWAPREERALFESSISAGCECGNFFSWWMLGIITHTSGWHNGFFAMSIIGCIFCVIFCVYASDMPDTHRWITDEEKELISRSSPQISATDSFRSMLHSTTFWTLALAHFGVHWGHNAIVIYAPTFITNMFGFNLMVVGIVAALPNGFRAIFTYIFTWSTHFFPAFCLLLMSHMRCNFKAIESLLILSEIFSASIIFSKHRSANYTLPHNTGIFVGTLNAIGHCSGIAVAYINGVILYNKVTISYVSNEPFLIFAISGGIHLLCGIVFILLDSTGDEVEN